MKKHANVQERAYICISDWRIKILGVRMVNAPALRFVYIRIYFFPVIYRWDKKYLCRWTLLEFCKITNMCSYTEAMTRKGTGECIYFLNGPNIPGYFPTRYMTFFSQCTIALMLSIFNVSYKAMLENLM